MWLPLPGNGSSSMSRVPLLRAASQRSSPYQRNQLRKVHTTDYHCTLMARHLKPIGATLQQTSLQCCTLACFMQSWSCVRTHRDLTRWQQRRRPATTARSCWRYTAGHWRQPVPSCSQECQYYYVLCTKPSGGLATAVCGQRPCSPRGNNDASALPLVHSSHTQAFLSTQAVVNMSLHLAAVWCGTSNINALGQFLHSKLGCINSTPSSTTATTYLTRFWMPGFRTTTVRVAKQQAAAASAAASAAATSAIAAASTASAPVQADDGGTETTHIAPSAVPGGASPQHSAASDTRTPAAPLTEAASSPIPAVSAAMHATSPPPTTTTPTAEEQAAATPQNMRVLRYHMYHTAGSDRFREGVWHARRLRAPSLPHTPTLTATAFVCPEPILVSSPKLPRAIPHKHHKVRNRRREATPTILTLHHGAQVRRRKVSRAAHALDLAVPSRPGSLTQPVVYSRMAIAANALSPGPGQPRRHHHHPRHHRHHHHHHHHHAVDHTIDDEAAARRRHAAVLRVAAESSSTAQYLQRLEARFRVQRPHKNCNNHQQHYQCSR